MHQEFSQAASTVVSAGEESERLSGVHSSNRLLPGPLLRLAHGVAATWTWRGVLPGLSLSILLTIAGFWIGPVIKGTNLAILYMLAVVFSALRWGRSAAIVSAVFGAFLFDYFFVPPQRTFALGDVWDLITLIGLLAVGLTVSMLTVAAREEAHSAKSREERTAVLYSFTQSLAAEIELDRILGAIDAHLTKAFRRPVAILLPESGSLKLRFLSRGLELTGPEKAAAEWVFANAGEAGCGATPFPESRFRFRPLKTGRGVIGVLGLFSSNAAGVLPAGQQQLLGTFLNQAALAITRANLAKQAQRAELLQETDKLQKALLNSVSHDLRTPLVSIIGGLNSVLHDSAVLDEVTQRALLETARDEAVRLNRLIQNLLDMSRLEGGAILARTEPCDVHDVVGAALEQLGEAAHSHPISASVDPGLPLVPMDHALIVQVLVNLLDNALKYSPAAAPIEIGARLEHGQLQIRVGSAGNEIPGQELDRVFDKFFRGSSARSSRGAGLGLSICKGFVEAHHGRIWAQRRRQGGTEFAFSLPLGAKA